MCITIGCAGLSHCLAQALPQALQQGLLVVLLSCRLLCCCPSGPLLLLLTHKLPPCPASNQLLLIMLQLTLPTECSSACWWCCSAAACCAAARMARSPFSSFTNCLHALQYMTRLLLMVVMRTAICWSASGAAQLLPAVLRRAPPGPHSQTASMPCTS